MNVLATYAAARDAGLRPALLESLGPPTAFSRRTMLALEPSRRLEVLGRHALRGRRPDRSGRGAARRATDRPATPAATFPPGSASSATSSRLVSVCRRTPPCRACPKPPFACTTRAGCGATVAWCPRRRRRPTRRRAAAAGPLDALPPDRHRERLRPRRLHRRRARRCRSASGPAGCTRSTSRTASASRRRDLDPLAYYARLRETNPSPFMGILEGPGWAVVSGSPERLFERHGEAS